MDNHIILQVVIRMLVPLIFMYGLYVQFHGEFSPGGGFQAGVICAVAFVAYGLVSGLKDLLRVLPLRVVEIGAAFGVLLYGGVGLATMVMGGKFLEYSVLLVTPTAGQHLGIFLIELGVGMTVFSVIMVIFYMFSQRFEA